MFGLGGLEIEQGAKQIHQQLTGLRKPNLANSGILYEKVGTHLRNAQGSYAETGAATCRH